MDENSDSVNKFSVRIQLRIEAAVAADTEVHLNEVRRRIEQWFYQKQIIMLGSVDISKVEDLFLRKVCAEIIIERKDQEYYFDVSNATPILTFESGIEVNVYQLKEEFDEEMADEEDINEQLPVFKQWDLPHKDFLGLWQSLCFDNGIMKKLTDYAAAATYFGSKGVNDKLITLNRLVLLHGPPGTGKTSLCRALSQKLSIELASGNTCASAVLLEINAHCLFSRWFSESGKLVMKMFGSIKQRLSENGNCLVCILIDEVESLTAARRTALQGNEPSDAIRVVNALLTQLDSIRTYPNTLILTTSNITEAIDDAFIDRADIKQFIGHPSLHCRFEILRGCIEELIRVGVVIKPSSESQLPSFKECANCLQCIDEERNRSKLCESGNSCCTSDTEQGSNGVAATKQQMPPSQLTRKLFVQVIFLSEGFSGRCLRKLPFQAFAFFCGKRAQHEGVLLSSYLEAILTATEYEKNSQNAITPACKTNGK